MDRIDSLKPRKRSPLGGNSASFAHFSHAVFAATFDGRLHPFDKALLNGLLFFALDSDRCNPSDGRLAELLAVSVHTIQRAMMNLEACGYIRRDEAPWTPDNQTRRVIVLVCRNDLSVLPPLPERHPVPMNESGLSRVERLPRNTRRSIPAR